MLTKQETLLGRGTQAEGAPQMVLKNLPANAGDIRDTGSIPGSGRSPKGGNGYLLQYFCLENPMDRETLCVGYSP